MPVTAVMLHMLTVLENLVLAESFKRLVAFRTWILPIRVVHSHDQNAGENAIDFMLAKNKEEVAKHAESTCPQHSNAGSLTPTRGSFCSKIAAAAYFS